MTSFVNVVRFVPTAGGTTDWTYSSAVQGYQSPSAAGAVSGALYRYRAESGDLLQWEIGYGTWNGSAIARTTVLANSSGTTAKINFSVTPNVALLAFADDVGGWNNRRIAKTAVYTVVQSDDAATIALGGSAFYALIFGAPSGYDANHKNKVVNEDNYTGASTGRGKLLLPVYATSSTSLTIAAGSKAFTVASGLSFKSNQRVRAFSLASSANFMSGTLTSYSSTTLTLSIDTIGGSGTLTDWQIAPETILWPGQNIDVFNNNGVWAYEANLWYPNCQVTMNVNPTNGSDSSDGLGTSSGAKKTITGAVAPFYSAIVHPNNLGPRVIDGGSSTIQEFVDVEHVPLGGGAFQIQNFNWIAANSGYCLQIGDWAAVLLTSVTMKGASAGATSPVGYIFMHQHAVLDTYTSFTVWVDGLAGSVIAGDGLFKVNINSGITVTQSSGTIGGFLYDGRNPLSQWSINGTHTFVGTPVVGRFAYASSGSVMQIQGNVTFSGAITTSVSLISAAGGIENFSGATLPGGTPTPTSPGWYVTSI